MTLRAGAYAARAGLPLGLLILAAAIPAARPIVLATLIAGFWLTARVAGQMRWAWAAPIPVAVSLCWGLLAAPLADPGGADCASLASPPAVWRATEAILALGSLGLLAVILHAGRANLALHRPARRVAWLAAAGAVILGPVGLLLGPALAQPFFGPIGLDLSRPGFIAPALVFAIANGVMEEVAYRGALLGWTARVTGPRLALVGQAIVFGLAHGGADVGGSPIRAHGWPSDRAGCWPASSASGRDRCSCRSPGTWRWTCRCTSTWPARSEGHGIQERPSGPCLRLVRTVDDVGRGNAGGGR